MLLYLAVGVFALLAVAGLVWLAVRGKRGDEIRRFHAARDLTTAWSEQAPGRSPSGRSPSGRSPSGQAPSGQAPSHQALTDQAPSD